MFDLNKTEEVIENSVYSHYEKAKQEIEKELTSAGYKHIFDEVKVIYTNKGIGISATFKEGIKTEGVDVFELLARGGALMKEDGSYIGVKPSTVLSKYLSKR